MNSHQHRLLPVMWAMMGLALFAALTVALLSLDSTVTGYVAGGLLGACILVCVVAYRLDNRSQPARERIRRTEDVKDLTAAP